MQVLSVWRCMWVILEMVRNWDPTNVKGTWLPRIRIVRFSFPRAPNSVFQPTFSEHSINTKQNLPSIDLLKKKNHKMANITAHHHVLSTVLLINATQVSSHIVLSGHMNGHYHHLCITEQMYEPWINPLVQKSLKTKDFILPLSLRVTIWKTSSIIAKSHGFQIYVW